MEENCSVDAGMLELQDAVTCCIHLGLLDDPRMLPCGHAICLECVTQCVRRLRDDECWHCPLCRQAFPSLTLQSLREVRALPRACLHNLIMHYINTHRVEQVDTAMCNTETPQSSTGQELPPYLVRRSDSLVEVGQRCNNSCRSNPLCDEDKENHSQEALDSTSSSFSEDNCSSQVEDTLRSCNSDAPSAPPLTQSDSISAFPYASRRPSHSRHASFSATIVSTDVTPFSSVYQLYDIDAIRINMRRQSNYHIQQRSLVKLVSSSYNEMILVTSGHLLLRAPEANSQIFLLNSESRNCSLLVKEHGHKRFHSQAIGLKANARDCKVVYLQGDDKFLYILLKRVVAGNDLLKIVKLNSQLTVVAESREFSDDAVASDTDSLTLDEQLGFCLSKEQNRLYLPLPHRGEIVILESSSLKESSTTLFLGPYHPSYVTVLPSGQEVWISCPAEKCILIVDDKASSIQVIRRDQLVQAIPTHIITTSDDRIIVLDAQQGGLLWLRRRNHYILLQRLDFHGALRHCRISGIQALPMGRILIAATDSYLIAKPNDSLRSNNSCHIL